MKKLRNLNLTISFFDIWFHRNQSTGFYILHVDNTKELSLLEITYRIVYKQLAIELFGKRWVISFKRLGKNKENAGD